MMTYIYLKSCESNSIDNIIRYVKDHIRQCAEEDF